MTFLTLAIPFAAAAWLYLASHRRLSRNGNTENGSPENEGAENGGTANGGTALAFFAAAATAIAAGITVGHFEGPSPNGAPEAGGTTERSAPEGNATDGIATEGSNAANLTDAPPGASATPSRAAPPLRVGSLCFRVDRRGALSALGGAIAALLSVVACAAFGRGATAASRERFAAILLVETLVLAAIYSDTIVGFALFCELSWIGGTTLLRAAFQASHPPLAPSARRLPLLELAAAGVLLGGALTATSPSFSPSPLQGSPFASSPLEGLGTLVGDAHPVFWSCLAVGAVLHLAGALRRSSRAPTFERSVLLALFLPLLLYGAVRGAAAISMETTPTATTPSADTASSDSSRPPATIESVASVSSSAAGPSVRLGVLLAVAVGLLLLRRFRSPPPGIDTTARIASGLAVVTVALTLLDEVYRTGTAAMALVIAAVAGVGLLLVRTPRWRSPDATLAPANPAPSPATPTELGLHAVILIATAAVLLLLETTSWIGLFVGLEALAICGLARTPHRSAVTRLCIAPETVALLSNALGIALVVGVLGFESVPTTPFATGAGANPLTTPPAGSAAAAWPLALGTLLILASAIWHAAQPLRRINATTPGAIWPDAFLATVWQAALVATCLRVLPHLRHLLGAEFLVVPLEWIAVAGVFAGAWVAVVARGLRRALLGLTLAQAAWLLLAVGSVRWPPTGSVDGESASSASVTEAPSTAWLWIPLAAHLFATLGLLAPCDALTRHGGGGRTRYAEALHQLAEVRWALVAAIVSAVGLAPLLGFWSKVVVLHQLWGNGSTIFEWTALASQVALAASGLVLLHDLSRR